MGADGGEEPRHWDAGSSGHEEKIFVSVRLRPLSEKEIARNDVSEWDCIDNTTIIFKNNLPERSVFLPSYTYDRVFGCDCSTKQVYEEGAKEVALSVVSGINSSIFAYGQTSSGKTYTMCGITEYAVKDIHGYIERRKDREFVLKFSAMEIYNEAVRDLLSSDTTPLRLLDDPERGTVVERLTEETLRDLSHLLELLSICDAQRQIGETSLNETSSRSHQILRLTVESSVREFSRAESSSTLSATVNFVDLAGSERASQTLSAGTRLKEGCHINRSLLTLGTVIRKLSKGRNGHVPYRDSKLTRILQTSLGGNARTAIICTMSPARSHVEQSRNTLLFASCAKEVATNAQVNVVMSDKVLLKHLQRELARLENELRSSVSTSVTCDSAALLKEKEILIEKMDKEIKQLIQQRDLAQSRVEDLLRSVGEEQVKRPRANSDKLLEPHMSNAWINEYSASESSNVSDPHHLDVDLRTFNAPPYSDRCNGLNSNKESLQLPENSEDHFLYDGTSPRLNFVGPDPCQGWEEITQRTDADSEDLCKEVRCIEMEESIMNRKTKADAFSPGPEEKEGKLAMTLSESVDDISSPQKGDDSHVPTDYDALKQKIQDMQKTIKCLASIYPGEQSPCSTEGYMSSSRSLKLTRSRSCRAVLMSIPFPPWFEKSEQGENTPPNGFEKDFQFKLSELMYGADIGKLSRKYSQTSFSSVSMDEKAQNIKTSAEGDITSADIVVAGVNEMDELKSENQFGDDLVPETQPKTDELGTNVNEVGLDTTQGALHSPANWALEFERQQREIIELWNACNVPLVHRTYFFLLFKGDPSDSVYMEVELRRLSFLKDTLSRGTETVKAGQNLTLASSTRTLNREREMLSKQMQGSFSEKERECLYEKWGIGLNTKQRRLQLARRLWTDTTDLNHVKKSAAIVANLVGFVEPAQAPKEMFGLSFSPRPMKWRSQSWKNSLSSIL